MSDIDKIIKKLFSERWTDNLANAGIEQQKKQLYKTLSDQTNGYWSGHTAYHLAVDGGFLIDEKSNTNKKLTELGKMFMDKYKLRAETEERFSRAVTGLCKIDQSK